jgi:hypothetical protein
MVPKRNGYNLSCLLVVINYLVVTTYLLQYKTSLRKAAETRHRQSVLKRLHTLAKGKPSARHGG